MKIRDFAQSRLDQMSIPVRFTQEDVERMGGSIDYVTEKSGDDRANVTLKPGTFNKKTLTDPETLSLISSAEVIDTAFKKGIPFYRECARFRELAGIAIIPDQNDALRTSGSLGWFTEIVTQPWFVKRAHLNQGPDVTMTAIMTWVATRLRSISHTSNWFVPSDPLTFQLLATDLRGVVVGDLKLPVSSFYVELPDGVFYLHQKATGWHSIRYLVVTEGEVTEQTAEAHGKLNLQAPKLGKRLLIEMYGTPNENSTTPFEDMWAFHSYQIGDPMANMEQAITDSLCDPEVERTHLRGKIGERELDGIEIRREILRFLMNLCIYLGTPEARVENFHKAEIDRLMKGRKLKNLREPVQKKARRLLSEKIFRVGSEVTVDPEIRDYVLGVTTGEGHKLAYRTVVRGHWRDQAHGPKHSLRRAKWIRPHVRGADLPTPIAGHTYEVR